MALILIVTALGSHGKYCTWPYISDEFPSQRLACVKGWDRYIARDGCKSIGLCSLDGM